MGTMRNITADGTALTPDAFMLEEVSICTAKGEAIDLQYAVQEIIITESIYSPTLICTVKVKDESNILEALPLYGLETIYVKIKRKMGPSGSSQEFERTFYITDYPLYGRAPLREHVQAWSVTGVSKAMWQNPMFKISRGYKGKISDEIVKIAKDAFKITVNYEGEANSEGQGIINIQTPMRAMDWFRRRLHDDDGSPYYLYDTLQSEKDTLELKSHAKLVEGKPHNSQPFIDTRTFSHPAGSAADFNQRRHKIISISSELKLSKFLPIAAGTWGSETNYVDIALRQFGKKHYSYKDDFPFKDKTLLKTDLFEEPVYNESVRGGGGGGGGSPTINKNEEKPSDEFYSSVTTLARNSEAFEDEGLQNYMEWSWEKSSIVKAFPGVFNTLHHEVQLFGDLELNAGKIIELAFPKAGDPMNVGGNVDEYMSGNYLVTSAIHRFKGQQYFTEVKVKRDSFVK